MSLHWTDDDNYPRPLVVAGVWAAFDWISAVVCRCRY